MKHATTNHCVTSFVEAKTHCSEKNINASNISPQQQKFDTHDIAPDIQIVTLNLQGVNQRHTVIIFLKSENAQ